MDLNDVRNRICWGPIIAGTAAALGIEIVLNFLGIGIGLTSLDNSPDTLYKIGMGAILWLAVTGIIAMFLAGFITGKFLKSTMRTGYHGFFVWCFATLITVMVSTSTIGVFISGPTNIIKSSMNTIGQKTQQQNVANNSESREQQKVDGETAKETANDTGKSSLILFAAYLVSAIATAMGARLGAKKED